MENQENFQNQRKAPRKNIPENKKGVLEIYSDDDTLLLKAPIIDISILGAGILLTPGMSQLLGSLKIVKNFVFKKAIVRIENLLVQTGVIWVWNNEGKSGIQFYKMHEEDQQALSNFIDFLHD